MRSEDFYKFVAERQRIRLRKESGAPMPWTDDEILRTYKFTNVFREYDWTSAQLIKNFYEPYSDAPLADVLMNAALFRYFGTFEFAEAVGWNTYDRFDFDYIRETARERLLRGERVFTGAYVITNQGIPDRKENVVVNIFLKGIHAAIPDLCREVQKTRSWKSVVQMMSHVPGFGGTGFMAKEILLDTTYTRFWGGYVKNGRTVPGDWWSWTPVGPGGRRGAARVAERPRLGEDASLKVIMDLYNDQDRYWPSATWGQLCPHDVQFQLCEFDKYERVRLGEGKPRNKYRPRS